MIPAGRRPTHGLGSCPMDNPMQAVIREDFSSQDELSQ